MTFKVRRLGVVEKMGEGTKIILLLINSELFSNLKHLIA